jgi:uncharacterized membrane protein YdjX (TVP38/TMEM64 family)
MLVASAPFIAYFVLPDGCIPSFYKWIQTQGAIGALVFAIVYVIICVFLLAPGELMSVAAGFLFGTWGAPLALLSSFAAALIAFLISRHFLRAKVKAWAAKRPLFLAIDAAAAEESWFLVVLLRLNPLVPPNLQNYFLGATNIGFVPYSIATFFGLMPLTAVYVYVGAVAQSIAFDASFSSAKVALLCVGFAVSAVVIYVMTKKAGEKLREMSSRPAAIELRDS